MGRSAGRLLAAARLAPDLLALTGRFRIGSGTRTVGVTTGRQSFRAPAHVLEESATDVPGLIVVRMPRDPRAVTAVDLDDQHALMPGSPLDTVRDLLCAGLSAAPVATRRRALAFLVTACAEGRTAISPELSQSLHQARSILRERLPDAVIDPTLVPSARVELLARIDERTMYVRGWVGHANSDLARLALVSPEGEVAEVPPTMFRYARPDVGGFYSLPLAETGQLGFATVCTFNTPSLQSTGWLLEFEIGAGQAMEADCPPAINGARDVRDHLVGEITLERPPSQALRVQHILPAIARLQERLGNAVEVTRVEQFGAPPDVPDVSIVVPLYKRIDFVEHQLAQFVLDRELTAADIVYVLDSPEQERQLLAEAERLARLYPVPFRVAVMSENGGFSIANNRGVTLARGRLVLLMNSDVLPDRPGWLGELTRFHDSLDDPGAVGPRLIYEDDSLQHAGMYFERPPGARLWFNEHYYKGLHRRFPDASTSRPVPAVSAACLMIRTELYRRLGGLRGMYVQGDFEDSDLCLRLHEAGHQNWYAADVELYHLEGQSYSTQQRHINGEFNRWLHTHLWDTRIEAVMATHELHDVGMVTGTTSDG